MPVLSLTIVTAPSLTSWIFIGAADLRALYPLHSALALKDGSAIIAGIQFTPIQYLHVSLNYQDWVEYAQNGGTEPFLYLNFEILFSA